MSLTACDFKTPRMLILKAPKQDFTNQWVILGGVTAIFYTQVLVYTPHSVFSLIVSPFGG